jgi:hypothetical protein
MGGRWQDAAVRYFPGRFAVAKNERPLDVLVFLNHFATAAGIVLDAR